MKPWKRWVARVASECAALHRESSGPRHGFRVLLYHAVGSQVAHDTYGMSVAPELFERQMAALVDCSAFRLVGCQEGLSSNANVRVAVTFDDGYRDNLLMAAPRLVSRAIPFSVFVVPAYVMSGDATYLTPAELKVLSAMPGCSIGAHGMTHRRLTTLDDQALMSELKDSRAWLEDTISQQVTMVAYPHGAVDQRVRDAAAQAGYTVGCCSYPGINDSHRDPLLLCRTEIVGADTMRVFSQKLEGAWDWTRWRSSDPAVTERLN